MAEVTYYVALPFVAADDGIAAGEPTECFNPNATVMRAEAPCDFGLVRSDDLVGQMVGRKGTTFWNSDFELEAGELEIAAHRGLST